MIIVYFFQTNNIICYVRADGAPREDFFLIIFFCFFHTNSIIC